MRVLRSFTISVETATYLDSLRLDTPKFNQSRYIDNLILADKLKIAGAVSHD